MKYQELISTKKKKAKQAKALGGAGVDLGRSATVLDRTIKWSLFEQKTGLEDQDEVKE